MLHVSQALFIPSHKLVATSAHGVTVVKTLTPESAAIHTPAHAGFAGPQIAPPAIHNPVVTMYLTYKLTPKPTVPHAAFATTLPDGVQAMLYLWHDGHV